MLSPTTDFPLPITTTRLILSQPILSRDDIHNYFNAVTESMNELQPWLLWAKYFPITSRVEEYIKSCNTNWITKNNNNIGLPLWIIDKESNKFLGNVVIWNIVWDIPKFEFGYWLRTSQTKKGYITEAINALTHYCFLQLGVNRIEIKCEIKNIRAQLVPKRLGFELDGILRNSTRAVSNGELTDTMLFSLIDLKSLPKSEVSWGR
ncbi:MAG: GNAT family N-acetyltransferase [Coxiellaceae bacterium]|jgi:RimJ/RimL family protein N-acetyltransferase|nr:GNAT family N-acetyltransferase [Coxiellaceae bacterium]